MKCPPKIFLLRMPSRSLLNKFMIQIPLDFFNYFSTAKAKILSEDSYDISLSNEVILTRLFKSYYELAIKSLLDRRNESFSFEFHGSYQRRVTILGIDFWPVIIRILLEDGHTHAVLPDFLIPYSNHTVFDYLAAILLKEIRYKRYREYLHYAVINHLKYRYRKYWKPIIDKNHIILNDSVSTSCFDIVHAQFMQKIPSFISNSLITF